MGYLCSAKRRLPEADTLVGYAILHRAIRAFQDEGKVILSLGLSPLCGIEDKELASNRLDELCFRAVYRSRLFNELIYPLQGFAAHKGAFCGSTEQTYCALKEAWPCRSSSRCQEPVIWPDCAGLSLCHWGGSQFSFIPAPTETSRTHRATAIAYGIVCHTLFVVGVGTMIVAMFFGMSRSFGRVPTSWGALTNAMLLIQFACVHSLLMSPFGAPS